MKKIPEPNQKTQRSTSLDRLFDELIPEKNASISFSKTVSESDVYLFAGITGDLHPNHVDQAYMQGTAYGERIAHGALIVGYCSAASTRFCERLQRQYDGVVLVSYGYDRIRFIKPVLFADTITVSYRLDRIIAKEAKLFSEVKVRNQRNELVAVMTHILKVLKDSPTDD